MSGSHSVCLKDLTAMTFTLGQTVRNMVSTKKNRLSCYHSYASFKVKSSLFTSLAESKHRFTPYET